jgi:predicted dehydrogenase
MVAPDILLETSPVWPADRTLGIGCVGAGFIMADCHLVAYHAAGFRPVAITSRRREQAAEVASRFPGLSVADSLADLLNNERVELVDVAVPPDAQLGVIEEICRRGRFVKGILAQKPLGVNLTEARRIVRCCEEAGKALVVNQNMRYDQSVRACKSLLKAGVLGEPVLATLDLRAIPHWMPWQERQGWVTLRILSIHHLDTFRFWFGDPTRVFASVRPDPRTASRFPHEDGICLIVLEYDSGLRVSEWDDVWTGPAREGAAADIGIRYRVEGTEGLAIGTIGWPKYPERAPSTLEYSTIHSNGNWERPHWEEAWFPDAFAGPMAELMRQVQEGVVADLNGHDNLRTMALVEACYASAREHRVIDFAEFLQQN